MASKNDGTTLKRKRAIQVLSLSDDENDFFLWKHIWKTYQTDIITELSGKGISMSDTMSGEPIATIDTLLEETAFILLKRTFNEKAVGMKAVKCKIKKVLSMDEIAKVSEQFQTDVEVGHNREADNFSKILWIVGLGRNVDCACKFIDEKKSKMLHCGKDHSEQVGETEKVTRDCFEYFIQLTTEEQATIWLYDLFDMPYIKGNNVAVYKKGYEIKLAISDRKNVKSIEKEIKERLAAPQYAIILQKLKSEPYFVQFLMRTGVNDFVKLNVNPISERVQAVWFQENETCVNVYAGNIMIARHKCELILDLIKEYTELIPSSYFSRAEAGQQLMKLEVSFKGKVALRLSRLCYSTRLRILCTSDINDTSIMDKIKTLFTSVKTVTMDRQFYLNGRTIFHKLKPSIENEYSVDIFENDNFEWIIKGEESRVQSAYNRIENLKSDIVSASKTYITDEPKNIVLDKVTRIIEKSRSVVTDIDVSVSNRGDRNVVDCRHHIVCRTWKLGGGSLVNLYLCNVLMHPWLMHNSLIVQITPGTEVSCTNIRSCQNFSVVTIHLPFRRGKTDKGNKALASYLDAIIESIEVWNLNILSVSFDLAIPNAETNGWSKTEFMQQILSMITQRKISIPVNVHEPLKDDCKKLTDIIENSSTMKNKLGKKTFNIKVKRGEIADETCDVIVNSTSRSLQLNTGGVSNSILRKAGFEIQLDCNGHLGCRDEIPFGEVIVTGGYNLSCKKVFHGSLPEWRANGQDYVGQFVRNCLDKAEHLQVNSIAFPALGTGTLGYSAEVVARTMFETAKMFDKDGLACSLTEVIFVVHPTYESIVWAFETAERMHHDRVLSSQSMSCTETTVVAPSDCRLDISVTSENHHNLDDTFHLIKNCLLKRERKETELKDDLSKAKEFSLRFPRKQQTKTKPDRTKQTRSKRMHPSLTVQEELEQQPQQSFTVIPQERWSFPQTTISQQQGNRQQHYSCDISKGFGNPQLVPSQSLIQQQIMSQVQEQQQRPQQTAPFYKSQNVRPQQQRMPMTYGQQQGQQMYPIMYMPPSQPGGNMGSYAAPIIVPSNHGQMEQVMSLEIPHCSRPRRIRQPTAKEHKVHHSLLAATGPDSKHFTKDCSMHSATILSDVCESEVKAMSLTSIHSDFNLPSNWSAMEDNENLKIVRLKSSDIEYIEVEQQFKSWQDMWHMNILKIERIQNRYLYQQYIAKKKFMDLNNRSGQNNESTLWHGTNSEAVKSINTYGFNRNYCGKNAAAYGNGAYFAVDSTFSAQNTYARPDTSNTKRMYMCKVLVGDYTKGHQGMKVPPQKSNALGSHIVYDSVVDNPKSPMIFVIFHDTQAYPTYLFDDLIYIGIEEVIISPGRNITSKHNVPFILLYDVAASYGNGVYFAVDPSYSAKNTYARPDASKTKRKYMCKVLVGDYTRGHHGMKVPPQKGEALCSNILYDSVVDNPKSPMIFVSFHDAQAYPTYLIAFDD